MAKASDNRFPKLIVTEGTTPASPAAGDQKLYIDSADHKLKRVNSTGTVTSIEGGGSGILAVTSYAPGTPASPSTSSTTAVDVDATNLAVTFTAPASGQVVVTLSALMNPPSATGGYKTYNWCIREGSTTLADHIVRGSQEATPSDIMCQVSLVLTGLSAGSHTIKWGHYVSGGTGKIYAGTGDAAVMTVFAA